MKKTLLSIITMAIVAILASNSAYAAHSVQKDISVEAKIAESIIITMDKADGTPFNSLELEYGPYSAGGMEKALSGVQSIKITAPQSTKVRISLAEEFVMHHEKKVINYILTFTYIPMFCAMGMITRF